MTRSEGLRGDRAQRSGPPEQNRDLTTELEDEMLASGRGHVVPREGLVGAHADRREGLGRGLDDGHVEPLGRGAEVAPTAKAEAREAERHQQQRQLGIVPAGTEGNPRQRREQPATRGQVDGAAREADTHQVEEQLYQDQKVLETLDGVATNATAARQRAAAWLREHKGALVIAGCGLLLAAVGLTTARYATR